MLREFFYIWKGCVSTEVRLEPKDNQHAYFNVCFAQIYTRDKGSSKKFKRRLEFCTLLTDAEIDESTAINAPK